MERTTAHKIEPGFPAGDTAPPNRRRELPDARTYPTIDVRWAADVLGVSPNSAYASIADGTFPVDVLRIGRRLLVPTAALAKALGAEAQIAS